MEPRRALSVLAVVLGTCVLGFGSYNVYFYATRQEWTYAGLSTIEALSGVLLTYVGRKRLLSE